MLSVNFKSAKIFIHMFWRDQKAAVLPYFAFGILALTSAIGLATDTGLGFLTKARMSKALDAAGLAAGRIKSGGDITAEALTFFNANFPANQYGAVITKFTAVPSVDNQYITLEATADIPTTFMRVAGVDTTSISAFLSETAVIGSILLWSVSFHFSVSQVVGLVLIVAVVPPPLRKNWVPT